jgi:hypothetical protein
MEFVDQLWRLIIEKFGHGVAWLILSVLGVLLVVLGRYLLQLLERVWCFVQSRSRALRAVARVVSKGGAHEGKGLWLTTPIHPPDDYKTRLTGCKILSIANLKGGVGKTTLAAAPRGWNGFRSSFRQSAGLMGQSLPKRDVPDEPVYTPITDAMLERSEDGLHFALGTGADNASRTRWRPLHWQLPIRVHLVSWLRFDESFASSLVLGVSSNQWLRSSPIS